MFGEDLTRAKFSMHARRWDNSAMLDDKSHYDNDTQEFLFVDHGVLFHMQTSKLERVWHQSDYTFRYL